MKTLGIAALAFVLSASVATAEEVRLTDSELDQVNAGFFVLPSTLFFAQNGALFDSAGLIAETDRATAEINADFATFNAFVAGLPTVLTVDFSPGAFQERSTIFAAGGFPDGQLF